MTEADHTQAHEGAAPMQTAPSGPLRGLRVIDLTRALAGPFCTMMLADLGADVIKVEPPEGDLPRYSGPFTLGDTEKAYGGYFASINRNKRGIVLDLKQPADRDRLLALVDGADVLMENFRVGVMDAFGLSYEILHERNPRLVYGAIRGFGDPRTGASPYAEWPAFDVVAQAMGGAVSATGTAEGDMVRVGPSIGDLYPATVAVIGVLAAVMHARQTGEGQFVDVSMVDALVALDEALVYRYSYTGMVTAPTGNSHPQLSPFDIYPTADGACAIAAPTPNHWERLCRLMDRDDLLTDERTLTNRERVANAEFVRAALTAWTSARPTAEIVKCLGGHVPVGPVNNAADLFTDPHIRARQMLVAVEHAGAERPVVFPDTPLRFTATPAGIYRRAPRLGEHTDEVFAELDKERG
jgi:crotonobetainyl-CoA:carnitine CoA-transferase CaiB-like acyl-CoA transferase